MIRTAVDSSMIAAVGYEVATERLEIEFTNGKVYEYLNFPNEEYENLIKAKSTGRYFNSQIKGAYASTALNNTNTSLKILPEEGEFFKYIKRVLVDSRLIESIGYDAVKNVLAIQFKSEALYYYYDFSESEYIRLMKSSSHGRYFLNKIKGHYAYKRIELDHQ